MLINDKEMGLKIMILELKFSLVSLRLKLFGAGNSLNGCNISFGG